MQPRRHLCMSMGMIVVRLGRAAAFLLHRLLPFALSPSIVSPSLPPRAMPSPKLTSL